MTKLNEKNDISQEFIRELFEYKDGFLHWRIKRPNSKIGNIAGYINKKAKHRRLLCINFVRYYHYRIIFLYHHGYLPKIIDHIDGNSLNDNIENLREATQQENLRNRVSNKNAASQYLGVSWHKNRNHWVAQMGINGKNYYLGKFDNQEDAALEYNKAAVKNYGEFANLNIIKL